MNETQRPFYTQALNFSSAVTGGVDPRTGLYGAHLQLGHLIGNNNLGPELPLTLSYWPLSRIDHGFGIGMSLGLSTYDQHDGHLQVATGEQYRTEQLNGQPILKQHKLDNLRFDLSADGYRILHKSGDIEILTAPNEGPDLKVVKTLLTATGHALHFDWELNNVSPPRLKAIRDDKELLLRITGTFGSTLHVQVWPDKSEGYELVLTHQNGLLTTLANHAIADATLLWQFAYSEQPLGPNGIWGRWLTGVTMPGGMSESVTYDADGNDFPKDVALPKIPYVTQLKQRCQGAPDVEASYRYTEENFVGGNTHLQWHPAQDNLFDGLDHYLYASEETRLCGGVSTKVRRTYNKFHLLISEQVTTGLCRQETLTDYHIVAGRWEDQPANYQLPKQKSVRWTDIVMTQGKEDPSKSRSREEVTTTAFDTFGNPTAQCAPDGTKTAWEYYPATGATGCPATPHGFRRYIKRVVVTPPMINGFTDVPTSAIAYRYQALAVPGNHGQAVLKAEECHYVANQLLSRRTFAYAGEAADRGRLTQYQDFHYPEGEQKPCYGTTHVFHVTQEGEHLKHSHVLTAHDGLTLQRQQVRSCLTGRLLEETDAADNHIAISYDRLGRVLKRTHNAGTAYENTSTCAYVHAETSNAPFQVMLTDASGNQIRQHLDGAGRLIGQDKKDRDGTGEWMTMATQKYDTFGRLESQSVMDRDPGHAAEPMQLTQSMHYDNWGQVDHVKSSIGVVQTTLFHPIHMFTDVLQTNEDETAQTGVTRTYWDVNHQPTKVEHYDIVKDGKGALSSRLYSQQTVQRDGLGRLRMSEDVDAHKTHYSYDPWGRLMQMTLPDGTVVIRHYAPSSAAALLADITVQGHSLGTQAFDGLGRLIRRSEGGRTQRLHYASATEMQPTEVETPDQQRHHYRYIPALQALQQRQAGDISQQFQYNPLTGAIRQALAGKMAIDYAYYPSGRLKAETIGVAGQATRETQYAYTLGGKLVRYQDVSQNTLQVRYDAHGRLATLRDPDVQVSLQYDALGLPYKWTTSDLHAAHTLTTELTRDRFHREMRRVLTDSQGGIWTIDQVWRQNGALASRQVSHGHTLLRQEHYTYDSRHRLTSYTCSGEAPPADEHGNPIVSQHFTYDVHSNITQCESRFLQGQDTARYQFDNPNDVHQLTGLTHSHPAYADKVTLRYDAAGRMIEDEAKRTLHYDALGRLDAVTASGKQGHYGYDALDRLVTQGETPHDITALYYRGETLVNAISDPAQVRLMAAGGGCAAQVRTGKNAGTWLAGNDGNGSALCLNDGHQTQSAAYTPYGSRPTQKDEASLLGLNGERYDALLGGYHLGNGYRAYHPGLMRFTSPDSLSPFGAGGLNPYAYCEGDPINHTDPSGHLSWQAILGIVGGVVGILLAPFTAGASLAATSTLAAVAWGAMAVTEVVSGVTAIASGALEESNPKAAGILGWVSLGTGLPSMAMGAVSAGKIAIKGVKALQKLAKYQHVGLNGGGIAAGKAMAVATERRLVVMGGTRQLMGHLNDQIMIFEDTYNGYSRINVQGHGGIQADGRVLLEGGGYAISAEELGTFLRRIIKSDGGNFKYIRLIMCRSADGEVSFAQQLANEINIPVKGFRGEVAGEKLFHVTGSEMLKIGKETAYLIIANSSHLPAIEKKLEGFYHPQWFRPNIAYI